MDQHRSSVPKNREPYRSGSKSNLSSRDDREKKNCPAGRVDIIAMVRSLQRTAGMTDCFRTGNAGCGITDCDWRAYCLGAPLDPKKNGTPNKLK